MSDFLLLLFVSSLQFSQPEAGNRAAEAYYKQSGMERALQEWTERETSTELRASVGKITFVTRTIVTQQVTFKWGF